MTSPRLAPDLPNTIVAEMAAYLRSHSINLDDERVVLLALTEARFSAGDITALADQAIMAASLEETGY